MAEQEEQDLQEERNPPPLTDIFKQFDKEGNGYITRDEIRQGMSENGQELGDEELNEMLKEIGIDEDGKVKYGEFVKTFENEVGEEDEYEEGEEDEYEEGEEDGYEEGEEDENEVGEEDEYEVGEEDEYEVGEEDEYEVGKEEEEEED